MPIDTPKASKTLKAAGFERRQAEAIAGVFGQQDLSQLATKADLAELATKKEISELATRAELTATRESLERDQGEP
ncbi:MAG TPA: hypothetical protein VFR34_12325 [Paracoccaceae bacterium]|nr:hypothetical protein [Paracoccaceae bacterium]